MFDPRSSHHSSASSHIQRTHQHHTTLPSPSTSFYRAGSSHSYYNEFIPGAMCNKTGNDSASHLSTYSNDDASTIERQSHVSHGNRDTMITHEGSNLQMNEDEVQRAHHVYSEDENPQVVLSLMWVSGKLGAAYYDAATCMLHLISDKEDDATHFYLLRALLMQTDPFMVVLSTKTDDRLLSLIKSCSATESEPWTDGTDMQPLNYTVQMLPYRCFSYEASKHRLLMISLPSFNKTDASESERYLQLSPLIDFNSTAMVCAAGALLKYLDKTEIGLAPSIPILGICSTSIHNLVNISDNTYRALQIFQQISHPSVYKFSTKEGISLFGIFSRCKSRLGSKELRRMFLNPTKDIQLLEERHAAIEYLNGISNLEVTQILKNSLKNIKNVMPILKRLMVAQATVTDWRILYQMLCEAITIGNICRAQPQTIPIFNKIFSSFTSDLHRLATLISKIVDFDNSSTPKEVAVKMGIDQNLDQKKYTYNGLPHFMTEVAHHELSSLPENITECYVIYLPQLGYMLSIPLTEEMKATGNYQIPNLEFMFVSNDVAIYKSASTLELDQLIGDIKFDISDHQFKIMQRLSELVLEISSVLIDVMKYSAELDCLLALSSVAKEFNLVKPSFNNDGDIKIIKGRHLLQELFVTSFAANDTFSGQTYSKMKIITGPNSSGKSVYIKQIGIIAYLAHIGSFVPAESADIAILDHIFTRIHVQESISVGLSTFLLSLHQMFHALRSATSSSLVLIDEFGKGTEAEDGLSLLAASLKYWLESELNSMPHVFVATHFHALYNHVPSSPKVTFQKMDIMDDDDKLVYLYQVVNGRADKSIACHIASLAGIPASTISRGKLITENLSMGLPLPGPIGKSTELKLKRNKFIVSTFIDGIMNLEELDVNLFLNWVKDVADINDADVLENHPQFSCISSDKQATSMHTT